MGLYKFYKASSNTGKVMIIGGVLVVGAIAWFAILNPIRKLIVSKLDQTKAAKEGADSKQALKDLANQGISPTITNAQAAAFCNSLVSAFAGCGTDEDAIYNVAKQLKNDADVYLLISTYGIRKYDACGIWTGDTENSLAAAISDELDSGEKDKLNGILQTNGCAYQFT